MGQNLSLTSMAGNSAGLNVPELIDLTYEKNLGTARLMKCLRARHRDGLVVVKIVMKPFAGLGLKEHIDAIRAERDALMNVPNALGYRRAFETSTSGFLVRQYMYRSLYDRLSTRPFLEDIEKKWLAFQLLCALRDSHARDIYHGDIKTENVLVTSWNWLYLTDYSSSYKPTRLPEDNPADFSFYFDTSGRRTCYVAPERFQGTHEYDEGRGLTWAMDIFSAGCVIGELFTESPMFNLSQLFRYRSGTYDPKILHLDQIQDENIRDLVSHMIQLAPESRYSAEQYLQFWKSKAFPEYFYSFLHQYMATITDLSSGRASVQPETESFGEADDRIDRIYYDLDKIMYFAGCEANIAHGRNATLPNGNNIGDPFPVQLDIPNYSCQNKSANTKQADDGSLIFLTLIVSSMRHTARAAARIRACDLLLALAGHMTDENIFDRILPYLVALLNDRSDNVKIAVLRTLTQLLEMVQVVSPTNAFAFTDYIIPHLQHFVGGPGLKVTPYVRSIYATCLSSLAHSAFRLLNTACALRADGSILALDLERDDLLVTDVRHQSTIEAGRNQILGHFEAHTLALLTDKYVSVRRALLGSIASLCVFFGSTRSNDVILSHLNTYLNDRDWTLKCAFLRCIVDVSAFVGGANLEEYILPLMLGALSDPEDNVTEAVLSSLASIAELGILRRHKLWELVNIVSRYTVHPNGWVRESATHFISASCTFASSADQHCIIAPLIMPFFKSPPHNFSEPYLMDSLKTSLSHPILHMAEAWATKAKKSSFWQSVEREPWVFSQEIMSESTITEQVNITPGVGRRSIKTDEDEQWMSRLLNIGLSDEDETKLLGLKDYIWKVASRRASTKRIGNFKPPNDIVQLRNLGTPLQTVFFGEKKMEGAYYDDALSSRGDFNVRVASFKPSTITDALLEASTSQTSEGDISRCEIIRDSTVLKNTNHRINVTRSGDKTINLPRDRLSSPPSYDKSRGKEDSHEKSSAIHLLGRCDNSKATAETGTAEAHAIGRINGRNEAISSQPKDGLRPETRVYTQHEDQMQVGHTYSGRDPTICKLLDSLTADKCSRDTPEFGSVTPVQIGQQTSKNDQGPRSAWMPRGSLVTSFGEHGALITRVVPAPDHQFFVTASDDGTVKVWDTLRLEQNLAHCSRLTFIHNEHGKVKALCFIENSHTFVSAATDGTIKAIRVFYNSTTGNSSHGRLRLLREYRLKLKGEYGVWLEHQRSDTKSILLIATNMSRIVALDLKSMIELYVLSNPVQHGSPTSFAADLKDGWLVIGTSRGILDLWDLRFQLRLKSWRLAGQKPIHRVIRSPLPSQSRQICITGGTGEADLILWDLERGACSEVFHVSDSQTATENPGTKLYDLIDTDDEEAQPNSQLQCKISQEDPAEFSAAKPDKSFRALTGSLNVTMRHEAYLGDNQASGTTVDQFSAFFLTGGVDRKLRFWSWPDTVGSSSVITGLLASETQPKYITTQPTTGLMVHTERVSRTNADMYCDSDFALTPVGPWRRARKIPRRQPRNTVINSQQEILLRTHLDQITDICILEAPVRMTVSVDRMGCIYVFQ